MKSSVNFIAADTVIEGKVISPDSISVEGTIRGGLVCTENASVGRNGRLEGPVHVRQLLLDGTITGNVVCQEKLVLLSEGYLEGNLQVPSGGFSVARGGRMVGQVRNPTASQLNPPDLEVPMNTPTSDSAGAEVEIVNSQHGPEIDKPRQAAKSRITPPSAARVRPEPARLKNLKSF